MKNKLLISCLSVCMVATISATPVLAENDLPKTLFEEQVVGETDASYEEIKNETETLNKPDLNSLMPEIVGWDTAFSEARKSYTEAVGGLPSEFKTAWNETGGALVSDFASLNYQYSDLQQHLAESGFGSDAPLDIPKLEVGYSASVEETFRSAFGDKTQSLPIPTQLEAPKLSKVSFPNGFNVSVSLNDMKAKRDAAIGEFTSSELFLSVKNNVGFSQVYNQASTKQSMPSLISSSERNTARDIMEKDQLKRRDKQIATIDLEEWKSLATADQQESVSNSNLDAKEKYQELADQLTELYSTNSAIGNGGRTLSDGRCGGGRGKD